METLLLVHGCATLMMAGLIWFVQLVHYPLFARVGAAAFPRYEVLHAQRTTWIVAPLMLTEAATAALLLGVALDEPTAILHVANVVLLLVIWLSTALLQMPCHRQLSISFDAAVVRKLVLTNWIRTAAWSLRVALVAGLVWMH
jgi:hypothetical protein